MRTAEAIVESLLESDLTDTDNLAVLADALDDAGHGDALDLWDTMYDMVDMALDDSKTQAILVLNDWRFAAWLNEGRHLNNNEYNAIARMPEESWEIACNLHSIAVDRFETSADQLAGNFFWGICAKVYTVNYKHNWAKFINQQREGV